MTRLPFLVLVTVSLGIGITAADDITFTKDIEPILQREYQDCHRSGQIAPMSFMTYEETRPWAQSIREAVSRREMPPWHADASHNEFMNDRRLSEAEIDTIVSWVDDGAKHGKLADAPTPGRSERPTVSTRWRRPTKSDRKVPTSTFIFASHSTSTKSASSNRSKSCPEIGPSCIT